MNYYEPLAPSWQEVPHNVGAEASLLGALLSNNRALDRCVNLRAEHFAGEHHGQIFAAIVEGYAAGHVVDPVSLKAQFDPALLVKLVSANIGFITVPDYARCIREAWEARGLIEIGEALVSAARSGKPPGEISELAARQIEALTMGVRAASQCTLDEAIDAAIAAMERAQKGQTSGISSGFPSFDRRLGGLEPGHVYVVGGRPAMGKSSVGHQLAMNAARSGVGVL